MQALVILYCIDPYWYVCQITPLLKLFVPLTMETMKKGVGLRQWLWGSVRTEKCDFLVWQCPGCKETITLTWIINAVLDFPFGSLCTGPLLFLAVKSVVVLPQSVLGKMRLKYCGFTVAPFLCLCVPKLNTLLYVDIYSQTHIPN